MPLFALLLALSAAPAPAKPIECVYNVYRKNDWPTLIKVVRQGLQGQTASERVMVDTIGEAVARCRKQYGWGKPREQIALRYFAGRVFSTDATYSLKKYGLDYEHLKALVDRLDPATRRAYVAGNVSNEQSAATFAALAAVGVSLDAVPAEERAGFARKLSQGVLGQSLELEAEADFAS